MADWNMLSDGDRLLVGVSGGIDSLVCAWVLSIWRRKAPIDYQIDAIHVDNGFWKPEMGDSEPVPRIAAQLERFGVGFTSVRGWDIDGERSCFVCARNRRSQLFELARQKGCNKIALGHHRDDLVETFLINAFYSGNVSTMLPRQELFGGTLSLIRVLSYLEKHEIEEIGRLVELQPVANYCPLDRDSRRETVRELLRVICREIPDARSSIFAALGNVRDGYML